MLDGVTSVVVTPGRQHRGHRTPARATGTWSAPTAHFRPTDRKVGEAFVAGDRLYVTSYGFMNGPLYYSDDDGAHLDTRRRCQETSRRRLTA